MCKISFGPADGEGHHTFHPEGFMRQMSASFHGIRLRVSAMIHVLFNGNLSSSLKCFSVDQVTY